MRACMPHCCSHIWPCIRPYMPHCCSHVAHVCPHIWPMYARMYAPLLLPCGLCMRLYMPYCCSHVTYVYPHIWPYMRAYMPYCCSHIWPMYEPITASKYGPFLPAYRLLLRAYMGYYCASPN